MATLEELLDKMPPEARDVVGAVWSKLSAAEKASLRSLVEGMPNQASLMRILLSLSSAQFKMAFGNRRRVVIAGPTNVGKSTLFNQFVQSQEDHAAVSHLPGTTRVNQEADTGLFALVDTPGADAAGEVGEIERDHALTAAFEADFIIILFDATQGIKRSELDIFNALAGLGKPYVVALNKADLVRKDIQTICEQAAHTLHLHTEQVIPISARSGDNLSTVLMAIVMTEPALMAALGQALPAYRWQLAWRAIASSASIAAAIAATPLPILDFAPLIITQSVMVLGIARIYNYKITLERARELVATFGLAVLGRALFQELSKLGGVPGWILAAAVAASTTVVMGAASVLWFGRGEKISAESFGKLSRVVSAFMVERFKDTLLGRRSKKNLQQTVESILNDATIEEEIMERAGVDLSGAQPAAAAAEAETAEGAPSVAEPQTPEAG